MFAAALALCAARGAQAQGVASLIEWDAPEACPGALELHARLSQVLGREPESLGKLSRVRGSVVRTAGGYRLVLEAVEHERRSSRLFEAASCDDLVDAAAIAVALAIAPRAEPAPVTAESAPVTAESATPVDRAPSESEPAASEAREASVVVRGLASASAVVEYGALPHAAPGIAVGGGVRWGAASLVAQGVLLASERLRVAPAQEIELELLYAGLRGCYGLGSGPLELGACACFEAGRLRAIGLDLVQAREASDLWLAVGAALESRWTMSRALALELRLEPMLPLNRKEYTIDGSEAVHAPSRVSARLYLGLVFSPE